jgi:hypothetical protein
MNDERKTSHAFRTDCRSSFIIHHSSFTKGDPAMLPNFSRHLAAQQASLKERTMSRHQLDLRGTDHD